MDEKEIVVGKRYRCTNNSYIWCHTRPGINHYIVLGLTEDQVLMQWTWDEDIVTGEVEIELFWDFFTDTLDEVGKTLQTDSNPLVEKTRLLGVLEGMFSVCNILGVDEDTDYNEDVDQAIENIKLEVREINNQLGLDEFDGLALAAEKVHVPSLKQQEFEANYTK